MTVALARAPARPLPPITFSADRLGDRAIAFLVFLGAFVIIEPAPYELLLVPIMGVWMLAGLRVNRFVLPLVLLLLAYAIGCALSLTQVPDLSKPLMYLATSTLLAFSAMFYAAVIPMAPERRLKLIIKAYTAGAVIAAVIGILGYFGVLPAGEFFTLYGRARGPFQDPNVFGPFLVLPFTFLVHTVLTNRMRHSLWQVVGAMLILIAIVLTFSRAAWAMTALSLMVTTVAAFVNQRSDTARLRLMVYVAIGGILVLVMLGVLLSLPGTSELFSERAQLVQYYDGGAGGRFDRWGDGFNLALDRPFGIGPYQFSQIFPEDEHNMWLKGFMEYGWLGGVSYIVLVIWTLIVSFPLLFKPRPWQPIVVCAFATYIGQIMVHFVVDNDHWRHLYLIYGLLWGAYAAERMYQRRAAKVAAIPAAIGPPVPTFRVTLDRAAPTQALLTS